ncbi:Bug family tripartite tricarboxylate transporter substrate binding protein [Caldovatus aquaticus]|uniref:Tripartite tricarboxylate transporter substrate binding protein n=1 Tax=Caldovatus aquaticus TaxID=2865671 RepID=A0ABS7F7D5_9PROT|nr:tripartite tricarboxylate transporter substrate binding protein [Caldovatus aquaticus]MBW8270715.1 tripartite tricarboxylate transporter substrate binding protein [Caldovatus aquaticus]
MHRRSLVRALAAAPLSAPALLAAPRRAGAQAGGAYPSRPVRIIVPFPAGGATDTWARLVAEGMQPELGQPIVIENRGGGGGLIGTDVAAKAPPDGYTLLYNITTHVQAPVVLRRFPYDPVRDFAFIGRLGTTAITFCVGPAVPDSVATLADFVAWGRGRPLAFGNYAQGSTGHAFALLLAREAGLNVTHVAYRGEAPMLQDLLAGQFHGGFHSTVTAGEMMRAGRIRPLATGGPDRVPSLADRVPTLLELGYSRRFGFSGFNGLFAPARVPQAVLDRLVPAFRKVATSPETIRRLRAMDTIPGYEDPETFRASVERALREWQEMAEALDLYSTA